VETISTIKLVSHCPKPLERVIEGKLRPIVNIKENQYVFQKERSATEPMFC